MCINRWIRFQPYERHWLRASTCSSHLDGHWWVHPLKRTSFTHTCVSTDQLSFHFWFSLCPAVLWYISISVPCSHFFTNFHNLSPKSCAHPSSLCFSCLAWTMGDTFLLCGQHYCDQKWMWWIGRGKVVGQLTATIWGWDKCSLIWSNRLGDNTYLWHRGERWEGGSIEEKGGVSDNKREFVGGEKQLLPLCFCERRAVTMSLFYWWHSRSVAHQSLSLVTTGKR